MNHCILLNADYSFLNIVDWKRALRLMAKGKVKVLKYSPKTIHHGEGIPVRLPSVLRLVKLIRTLYRNRVPFSKKNILIRDNFQCAYCGSKRENLTIDHIIPRSRGGGTDFENCVACCRECNNRKGNRTPKEAGMFLNLKVYQPTIAEFLMMRVRRLHINDILQDLGVY